MVTQKSEWHNAFGMSVQALTVGWHDGRGVQVDCALNTITIPDGSDQNSALIGHLWMDRRLRDVHALPFIWPSADLFPSVTERCATIACPPRTPHVWGSRLSAHAITPAAA